MPTTADTAAGLAHAVDTTQPLTLVKHYRDDDAYQRGPVLLVIPAIWTGMPTELLATVRHRRACDVTGRCPMCGACLHPAAAAFIHRHGCPVSDNRIRPVLAAWYRRVGQFARGQRIRETP